MDLVINMDAASHSCIHNGGKCMLWTLVFMDLCINMVAVSLSCIRNEGKCMLWTLVLICMQHFILANIMELSGCYGPSY